MLVGLCVAKFAPRWDSIMPSCPTCNAYLTPLQLADNDCPDCRGRAAASGPQHRDDWRSAAKVVNLAEAGYLASRLEGEGIAARLVQSDSFSAVDGTWSSYYVLQVPSDALPASTELIRLESEQLRGEEPDFDQFGEPIEHEPVHLVFWRPVALMAVAGLATLWLGQHVPDPRPRVAPHRSAAAMAAAVEALGEPMVVVDATGRTTHRLRYRSDSRSWLLESDTNHDGRFDRRQRFVLEPAAP